MKYIKKLNIDFDNWDETINSNLPPITIDLLCYLKMMTGYSGITKHINKNILNKLNAYGFVYIYSFLKYYCDNINDINNNEKEFIYNIFNEINIKNENKYNFYTNNLKEHLKSTCKYCEYNENVIMKYYKDYYETY